MFKTLKQIDHKKIEAEAFDIINRVDWKNNQISLQYTDEVSWHNDVDYYGKSRDENACVNYHPDIVGTYIHKVLTDMDFPVASARLMLMQYGTAYETHVDLYTRYHIAIQTDPLRNYMVFPDKPFIARMETGNIYWTDTHELHTFVNGSLQQRIHIIFNNANEKPNYKNPYLEKLYGTRFTQQT
jgi:hypothetical protein